MKARTALFCMLMICLGGSMGSAFAETAPPPPPLPKLEPIPEPVASASSPAGHDEEVTVSKRGGDRIEEFRFKGRLYMIRVTPAIGLPYTLVDDKGDGVFNRKDARGTPIKPAQWKVLSW